MVREAAGDGLTLRVVVHRDRIGELILRLRLKDIRRERKQLIERAALTRDAVLEQSLALHPAVVGALVHDVDLFDVVHPDVRHEHRSVGEIPRQPVRVPESVRVDLTERLAVAVRRKRVDRRNRVVAEALRPSGHRRTARVDAEDRADHRVEPLCLRRVVGVRPAAVAEPEIAAARVEQAVVAIARLRR